MSSKLLEHIVNIKLSEKYASVLCAVSGGKDSMAMIDVLRLAGVNLACAHVNHQTRGNENLDEQALVTAYCEKYNIPLHLYTLPKSVKNASNFQAKARELRYEWFFKLLDEYGYNVVATAHHQSDNAESLLMALMRGSGLDGLSAIAFSTQKIIRPFLHVTREDIDGYVASQDLPFLEDSSNRSMKYLRNRLRHTVIRDLQAIDVNALQKINDSIQLISESNQLLKHLIFSRVGVFTQTNDGIELNLNAIKEIPNKHIFLYYIIKDYGFNSADIADILTAKASPCIFYSKEFQASLDRSILIISKIKAREETWTAIDILGEGIYQIGDHSQMKIELTSSPEIPKEPSIETLGFDSYPFPLVVRMRKEGDRFKPLGMGGKSQKLKEFINNNKLNLQEKRQLFVVESKGEIAYVAPYRLSESFKVTSDKNYFLKISIKNLS